MHPFHPGAAALGLDLVATLQTQNSRFREGMSGLHAAHSEMKSIPCATVLPPYSSTRPTTPFLHDPAHYASPVPPRFIAFPLHSR